MTSIKRVVEAVGRLWKKFFLTTIKVAVLLKNDCLCPLLSKEKAPYQVLYEERPFVHGSLSIISLPKRRTVVENKLDCFNRKKSTKHNLWLYRKWNFQSNMKTIFSSAWKATRQEASFEVQLRENLCTRRVNLIWIAL